MAATDHYDAQARRNVAACARKLGPQATDEARYRRALAFHREKAARYGGPEPAGREGLDSYLYGVCIVEAEAKHLAGIRAELDRRAAVEVSA